eukprot:2898869-Pleurochrysis_carterae.AAC.1
MSLGAFSRRTTGARGREWGVTRTRVGEVEHCFECAAGRKSATSSKSREAVSGAAAERERRA